MNNKIVYFSIVATVILLRIGSTFFGITGGHPINLNIILVDAAGCLSYLLIYATFSKYFKNQTLLTTLVSVGVIFILGGILHEYIASAIYYFMNPTVFQIKQEHFFTGIKVEIIKFSFVFCLLQIPIILPMLIWKFVRRRYVGTLS